MLSTLARAGALRGDGVGARLWDWSGAVARRLAVHGR